MLTVAIPKRNKLQNIIVLTPKDGNKYKWGFLVGLCYFVLLMIVSFAVQRRWDMSAQHAITTFFMCLGGGTLGGMLS